MAQSIALFFHDAEQSQLRTFLDKVAERTSPGSDEWEYPVGDHYVAVYTYDSLLDEFEDDDLNKLLGYFDEFPSAILCIEFRESHGMAACESASELAQILLSQFKGIATDLYDQFWTDKEANEGKTKDTGSFAQSVRYPPSLEVWEATLEKIKAKRRK
jgi:hypothetical protein